ncbi:MAG: VCBS repeat-containing protein [candidate division NC10 bacterium]
MTLRMARALGLVLLILAGAVAASGQTAPPTLGVLVNQVLALFPRADAEVIEVQGGTVTLSLGQRDGLVAGIELALYREGRELRHPRTGEVLGRTEQALGRLAVRQVFEAYSVGAVAPGTEVRPGDRARVSAGKIKLTLLPLVDGVKDGLAEAATYELIEALNRTGRFQIALGDAVGVWLGQQGIKRPDVLEGKGLAQVGERFKVERLLVVSFTRVEKKPYMDVRLFTFPGVNALLTTALFVPPSIKAAPKGDFSAAGRSRESQTPSSQRSLLARLLTGDLDAGTYSSGESSIPLREIAKFPFAVVALDVAVAPKDGVARVVVTDGEKVYLYKFVERVLEAEWTYRADSRGRVFSVQLADLDGDGVLEVVANRYNPNPAILMTSFVLATKGGKPAVLVEDIGEILLAVDADGAGIKKTLWIQPFSQQGFFKKGEVLRASIRNGKLVTEGRVRVPSAFRATGAAFANINGKDPRALAFVDEFNRLQITVDTEDLWRSSALVGGGGAKLEVLTQIERGGRSYLYASEPPPLAVDLDGDGVEEIVVPQNQLPGRLAVVYKGPAGYRFQTVNSGFEGTLTGLGALPGDGAPTLVMAVVRYQNLFNTVGDTQIIVTTGE